MKPISITSDGALRGHLSADVLRWNTLLALVQDWDDEETRARIIASLDGLAAVASDTCDPAAIGRRISDVETVADLGAARVAVAVDELRRIRDEADQAIDSILRTHLTLLRPTG